MFDGNIDDFIPQPILDEVRTKLSGK